MEKIKVKIKKEIAKTGCGFYDMENKQELFPRDEKNKLKADKVFEVKRTPFINSKLSSGEIELVSKVKSDTGEIVHVKVAVNSDEKLTLEVDKSVVTDIKKLKATVFKNQEVKALLNKQKPNSSNYDEATQTFFIEIDEA